MKGLIIKTCLGLIFLSVHKSPNLCYRKGTELHSVQRQAMLKKSAKGPSEKALRKSPIGDATGHTADRADGQGNPRVVL